MSRRADRESDANQNPEVQEVPPQPISEWERRRQHENYLGALAAATVPPFQILENIPPQNQGLILSYLGFDEEPVHHTMFEARVQQRSPVEQLLWDHRRSISEVPRLRAQGLPAFEVGRCVFVAFDRESRQVVNSAYCKAFAEAAQQPVWHDGGYDPISFDEALDSFTHMMPVIFTKDIEGEQILRRGAIAGLVEKIDPHDFGEEDPDNDYEVNERAAAARAIRTLKKREFSECYDETPPDAAYVRLGVASALSEAVNRSGAVQQDGSVIIKFSRPSSRSVLPFQNILCVLPALARDMLVRPDVVVIVPDFEGNVSNEQLDAAMTLAGGSFGRLRLASKTAVRVVYEEDKNE